MRPIKLIISAFGPYSNEVSIDFEQLSEKGLFLIAGDTGAGKTTIFDAICFALYGTASGNYRDAKNLRSEYVADDVESFVDFYFSHQGKMYHVWRSPSYERRKKRGEGVKWENGNAILYEEGKSIKEGIKPVNIAVKDLLGVDDKQFKQIVMIAQGEFRELLNAKTDQRTEILRMLFGTGAYKEIEYRLKDKMDESFKLKSQLGKSIAQYFMDTKTEDEDEIKEAVIELQEKVKSSGDIWSVDEILQVLQRQIQADKDRAGNRTKELNNNEMQLKQVEAMVAKSETNNKLVNSYNEVVREYNILLGRQDELRGVRALLDNQRAATYTVNPAYAAVIDMSGEIFRLRNHIELVKAQINSTCEEANQMEQLLVKLKEEETVAEELGKKIDRINEEKDKYRQRDEILAEAMAKDEIGKGLQQKLDIILSEENALKIKTEALQNTIAENKNKPAEYRDAVNQGELYISIYKLMDGFLEEQIQARSRKIEELASCQERYINAREKYDVAFLKYSQAEKVIEKCRAGLLAKELKEGDACPVCGSTHHQNLAKLPDDAITEEEYKQIKKKQEELYEKKNAANTNAEKAKTALYEHEQQLKLSISDCLKKHVKGIDATGKNLDELISLMYLQKQQLKIKIDENLILQGNLEKTCKLLQESEQALAKAMGEESSNISAAKQKLMNESKEIELIIVQLKARLESLKELSYENWAMASDAIKAAEDKINSIMLKIRQADEKKKALSSSLIELNAALKTHEDNLIKLTADEQKLKELLNKKLQENHFNGLEEMLQFVVPDESINANQKIIDDYNAAASRVRGQIEQVKEYKDKQFIDVDKLKQDVQIKKQLVDEAREKCNEVNTRITVNSERYDLIADKKNTYEKADRDYKIYKKLYNLVKGTTSNGKITLEQYIQAAGFDAILAAANKRLYPMTGGQYELYRQENSIGKQSNNFLDLEVIDNFTGHRRPVGNLSGGESFKAALSLALGLSDKVSADKGGIQMDALFIDEGFGTLDRKSMGDTMDILLTLSNSNKLVGIISHREELIDSIPQKIIIKKTMNGSKIETSDTLTL